MTKSFINDSIMMKRSSSKITNRRTKRPSTKEHTEGLDTVNSSISPLDSTLYPLYISEHPNQEETIKDNHMRIAQSEKVKFY